MPSVPNAIRPPAAMMSRTRQIPVDRRKLEPGLLEATAPESAKTRRSSSVTQTKCSSTVAGVRTPRSASRRTAVLPYVRRLNNISARVSSMWVIMPVPCSSASRRHLRYSSSEQAGVQSGAVQPAEAVHHLVHRPRVSHRRAPDFAGQVLGEPCEELVVRLVRVDVLV